MPASPRQRVSGLIDRMRTDAVPDPRAAADLLPLVYEELKRLARARLHREPPGSTLQATALVHEAYLRLLGGEEMGWTGRAHFFGAAALAMRRILVDRARARGRLRRGGARERITLAEDAALAPGPELDLLALDEALERLQAHDKRKAEVVYLRFFAGLDLSEIARAQGVSPATVKNDWSYARAWLHRELARAAAGGGTAT